MQKITCGHCKKDVRVTSLNRVYTHNSGPGFQCIMSGARPEAAITGKRFTGK